MLESLLESQACYYKIQSSQASKGQMGLISKSKHVNSAETIFEPFGCIHLKQNFNFLTLFMKDIELCACESWRNVWKYSKTEAFTMQVYIHTQERLKIFISYAIGF